MIFGQEVTFHPISNFLPEKTSLHYTVAFCASLWYKICFTIEKKSLKYKVGFTKYSSKYVYMRSYFEIPVTRNTMVKMVCNFSTRFREKCDF